MKHFLFILPFLPMLFAAQSADAAELLYFRSDACSYCEMWDEDVGVVYSKTDEAKVLTLRAIDIYDPVPDDVSYVKGVVYTPTFVAVENGREVGRIVGYGGDDFFWQQMATLMVTLKHARATATTCPDEAGFRVAAADTPSAC